MSPADQQRIDTQMAHGTVALEHALDALDVQPGSDPDLRHRLANAMADSFRDLTPPLDHHQAFVERISRRGDERVPVFTLNYDCLIERSADAEEKSLNDGFRGIHQGSFDPSSFARVFGRRILRRRSPMFKPDAGVIHLYKLHGSLGWFAAPEGKLKRFHPDSTCPDGWRRLMVPPQYRKAADTGFTPYSALWSDFRAYLANDTSRLLNRLVCIGYGFGDGHVNDVLWSGLARQHFTLIVLAKALPDIAFNRLADSPQAVVVTETRSALQGERGVGVTDAWSFEWFSKEV